MCLLLSDDISCESFPGLEVRVKGWAGRRSDINVRLCVSGPTGNGRLLVFQTPQMPGPQTLMNGIPSNVHHLVTATAAIIKTFFFPRLPSHSRNNRKPKSKRKTKGYIFPGFLFLSIPYYRRSLEPYRFAYHPYPPVHVPLNRTSITRHHNMYVYICRCIIYVCAIYSHAICECVCIAGHFVSPRTRRERASE